MTRSRKQLILIIVVMVTAFVVYGVVRFFLENNEGARLRGLIRRGAASFEREDLRACLGILSENYSDSSGFDKARLEKYLRSMFAQFNQIRVVIKRLNIEMADDGRASADVGFTAYFKVEKKEKLYYETAKFHIEFIRQSAGWRVVSIEYTGVQDALYLHLAA